MPVPTDVRRYQQVDRPPPTNWENHTYRPEIIPSQHTQRVPPVRDHKRPRQESTGHSRRLDSDGTFWTRGAGFEPTRHSRQGSFQPPTPVDARHRERTATGTFHVEPRRIITGSMPPSPTKARPRWEGSDDEQEYSGDEMARSLGYATQPSRQAFGDVSRSRDTHREVLGHQRVPSRDLDYRTPGPSNIPSTRPTHVGKVSEPVARHAWDSSPNQPVQAVVNDARSHWQAERRVPMLGNMTSHPELVNQASSGRSPRGK